MDSVAERLARALSDRYRIERELGVGGMATVYLAEDLRHKRKVAVKVLKPELAAVLGGERFVQEITTTASLQHPHILPLFDSGTAEGFLFYVMPYIEGETLREKLDRETQLGVDEAVRITREVADALDYAHRRGIIHRDIKPENILLHDGRPMVADFGIALAVSAAAGGRMTETGTSVGTPHYMSPEQATADKEITSRADIYSLASVLYEMLAGEPPHTGASAQAVIMKIITDAPRPVTELRKSVPAHVGAAVATALEKLPADRFDGAKAFATALADPEYAVRAGTAAGTSQRGTRDRRLLMGTGVIALLGIVLALWGWLRPVPVDLDRVVIGFPPGQSLDVGRVGRHIAVSRDGSLTAWVGRDSSWTGIWLKRRDEVIATRVPGTEGGDNPFFSPDGREIGFFTGSQEGERTLKIATIEPAATRTLATLANAGDIGLSGAVWGLDGQVYFDSDSYGLQRVAADGRDAAVERFVALDSTESGVAWPDLSPDGKVLIFRMRYQEDPPDSFDIVAMRIETGERHVVTGGVSARFVGGDHIAIVKADGSIRLAPFDAGRLALEDPGTVVASGVRIAREYAAADLVTTSDGELYFVAGRSGLYSSLIWMDRNGNPAPAGEANRPAGRIESFALSPDGSRVALEIRPSDGRQSDIWIEDLTSGGVTRLTRDTARDALPTWSPDGRYIYFRSHRATRDAVFRRRVDGIGGDSLVLQLDRNIGGVRVSNDGRWLIVSVIGPFDVFAAPLDDLGAARPLLADPFSEYGGALSPDGRWIAYVSEESGTPEVWVRPFPDVNRARWLISVEGGTEPVWARSGRELFYRTPGRPGRLMSLEVDTEPDFHHGPPRPLFLADGERGFYYALYDVDADDQRFLLVGADTRTDDARLVRIADVLGVAEAAGGE